MSKDIHERILEYLYDHRDTTLFLDLHRKFSSYTFTAIKTVAIELEDEGLIKILPEPPSRMELYQQSAATIKLMNRELHGRHYDLTSVKAKITFKGINYVKSSNVKEDKNITINAQSIGNVNTGNNNTIQQKSSIKKKTKKDK